MWAAKALARLRTCAGSPEPLLVAYVISTIISWVGWIIIVPNLHSWCFQPDCFNTKDWQDGLRALLPNINISFGSQQNTPPDTRPNTTHLQHQQKSEWSVVKIKTICTSKKMAAIIQNCLVYPRVMCPKDAEGMANSEDPDQTGDQCLHCLPRQICQNT